VVILQANLNSGIGVQFGHFLVRRRPRPWPQEKAKGKYTAVSERPANLPGGKDP